MRAPVTVRSGRDIAALVHEIGFLPFYPTCRKAPPFTAGI